MHDAQLHDDMGSNKLSLLLDENNDALIVKFLGAFIIYINHVLNKIESTYLGFAQWKKCDARSIVRSMKKFCN